jgi:hypothetical protein
MLDRWTIGFHCHRARSAKVVTGFASDRARTVDLAHDLIGEPVATSPDHAR